MKRVIGYTPVIKEGKTLYRPIYEMMRPKPPSGNEMDIDDIPPLDAGTKLWGSYQPSKERG